MEVPKLDVFNDEIEAVLSFLKMELGFYFYDRVYTKQEEDDIEKRRVKREPTKVKPANKPAVQIPSVKAKPNVIAAPPPPIGLVTPAPPKMQPNVTQRMNKWVTRFDQTEQK